MVDHPRPSMRRRLLAAEGEGALECALEAMCAQAVGA
jgi:hypothetical protein